MLAVFGRPRVALSPSFCPRGAVFRRLDGVLPIVHHHACVAVRACPDVRCLPTVFWLQQPGASPSRAPTSDFLTRDVAALTTGAATQAAGRMMQLAPPPPSATTQAQPLATPPCASFYGNSSLLCVWDSWASSAATTRTQQVGAMRCARCSGPRCPSLSVAATNAAQRVFRCLRGAIG